MLKRSFVTLVVALGVPLWMAPAFAAMPASRFVVGEGSEVAYRVNVKTLGVLDEQIEGRDDAVRGEVKWAVGVTPSGWVEADVAGFHSGITSRDQTVAKMLGAPATPHIRFELGSLEGFSGGRTSGKVLAVGQLKVNGRSREVRVSLTYTLGGGQLKVDGETLVHFTDFGIAPPVLGLVFKRAPDVLSIHVHLVAHDVH
jgi:polyisoprenoid-binding protein YceI